MRNLTFITKPVLFLAICLTMISESMLGGTAQATTPFQWGSARKEAIGTAYEKDTAQSPVWWTVSNNHLSEIYYPQVDSVQVAELKPVFLFPDGQIVEHDQMHPSVRYSGFGQVVEISFADQAHGFEAYQRIVNDPRSARLQSRLQLHCAKRCPRVFFYFKPAIQAKASQSQLQLIPEGVIASGASEGSGPAQAAEVILHSRTDWVGKAIAIDEPRETLITFLKERNKLPRSAKQVGPGQVSFLGEVEVAYTSRRKAWVEIALSFQTPQMIKSFDLAPLRPWSKVESDYAKGWQSYLKSALARAPWLAKDVLAKRSIQILQMHADKKNPGAFIAAFSIPGIPDLLHAFENYAGYHLVWPRDLYQIATGYMAINDWETVRKILTYLNSRQSPEGRWPQNFWVDGTPSWTSLQLDEVGYPILLAHQIAQKGMPLLGNDLEAVRRAAQFISQHGPRTPQERWEELGGYSPNTLAIEIAALKAAHQLLGENHWLELANDWQQKIDQWTVVTNGAYGSGYFLRISPNGTPSVEEPLVNARGKTIAASSLLDLGFLDLVRWGLRPVDDAIVVNTLSLIDQDAQLSREGYVRRYNGDHYGWQGRGGYWPLLTGERAEFECWAQRWPLCRQKLKLFRDSQTTQGHLPEQIDKLPVEGPGTALVAPNSASPLAWAHAGYLRLLQTLQSQPKR